MRSTLGSLPFAAISHATAGRGQIGTSLSFAKADRIPPAWAVRLSFIAMVVIGTGLVVLSLRYWLRQRGNGPGPEDRLTLAILAARAAGLSVSALLPRRRKRRHPAAASGALETAGSRS